METTENRKPIPWKRVFMTALCLCVTMALVAFVRDMLQPQAHTYRTRLTENGVVVDFPVIDFSTPVDFCDVPTGFFYHGNTYYLQSWCMKLPEDLVGEKIGTASRYPDTEAQDGLIHYTGNFSGDIYTVKGYNPTFLLCREYPGGFYPFLRNGGFIMQYGGELFREELHLSGDYTQVLFGTYPPHYAAEYTGRILTDHAAVERFLAELCAAEFLPVREIPYPEGVQYHSQLRLGYLHFQRPDGTTTTLYLYENGYVSLLGMDMICVKVPDAEFDAFTALLRPA